MNSAIALQRPSYKGKLNFDEETYLGVIAFGNALGNSIVSGIQSYEYNKNVELNNKLAGFSQQLTQDAYKNIKNTGALDLTFDLSKNQQFQNNLNSIIPKDKTVKQLAGLGGIDVGAANARNAGYRNDLAIKTQQAQQTKFRVNELVAESNQLLGNNTDVSLYGNGGAYGVPPLLARPDAGLVNLPRQTINQTSSSWLDQINTNWSVWEKNNAYLSEGFGRQSLLGTLTGFVDDAVSHNGYKPLIPTSSAVNGQVKSFSGWRGGKGYWLGGGMTGDITTATYKNGIAVAREFGVLHSASRVGGVIGAITAPIGRAIEYSMDGKPLNTSEFAIDAGLDIAKGAVSGAVAGYVGVAVATGTTAALVGAGAAAGSVVPIIGTAIGAVVGLGVSLAVSYGIEHGYYNNGYWNLRN